MVRALDPSLPGAPVLDMAEIIAGRTSRDGGALDPRAGRAASQDFRERFGAVTLHSPEHQRSVPCSGLHKPSQAIEFLRKNRGLTHTTSESRLAPRQASILEMQSGRAPASGRYSVSAPCLRRRL